MSLDKTRESTQGSSTSWILSIQIKLRSITDSNSFLLQNMCSSFCASHFYWGLFQDRNQFQLYQIISNRKLKYKECLTKACTAENVARRMMITRFPHFWCNILKRICVIPNQSDRRCFKDDDQLSLLLPGSLEKMSAKTVCRGLIMACQQCTRTNACRQCTSTMWFSSVPL